MRSSNALAFTLFFVTLLSCGRGTEELVGIGLCTGYSSPEDSKYVLPYEVGKSYEVTQGNCGPQTHHQFLTYAYDFDMPIGETLVASRGGKVVFASEGTGETACAGKHIVISHGDGTYARYLHMSELGVSKGDSVDQGEEIGRSGDTSCAPVEPHLHFDVSNDDIRIDTIPVTFSNTSPNNKRGLKQGKSYTAE